MAALFSARRHRRKALELERLIAVGRDALTAEMVSRLSATAADGWIGWTRSSARTSGAAQHAVTDEMVARMAGTVPESLPAGDLGAL